MRGLRRCTELWVITGHIQQIAQGQLSHPRRIRG
jgi:hypothetical protein